jgi:uncharacterized OsmC-like protein
LKPDLAAVYAEKRKTYTENPGKISIPHTSFVKQVDGFYQEAKLHQFTVYCDEHAQPWGGSDRGPSPLLYLFGSLGFSINNQILIQSAILGVDIKSLETSVTGSFDPKGCYNIKGHNPRVTSIQLVFKVASDSSEEKWRKVLTLASKSCPIYQTLKPAAKIEKKLELNGSS